MRALRPLFILAAASALTVGMPIVVPAPIALERQVRRRAPRNLGSVPVRYRGGKRAPARRRSRPNRIHVSRRTRRRIRRSRRAA